MGSCPVPNVQAEWAPDKAVQLGVLCNWIRSNCSLFLSLSLFRRNNATRGWTRFSIPSTTRNEPERSCEPMNRMPSSPRREESPRKAWLGELFGIFGLSIELKLWTVNRHCLIGTVDTLERNFGVPIRKSKRQCLSDRLYLINFRPNISNSNGKLSFSTIFIRLSTSIINFDHLGDY